MPVILYERQRQALDFIAQFIQRNGYAPALRDIANAMNLRSLATIHEHLDQLQKRGVIKVSGRGKNRKIEIVDKKMADIDRGVRLPILGFISQGKPIEPYSNPNAFIGVAPSMVTSKTRAFILHVKDDSLEKDGIFENDLLVMEEETKIKDNEIAVILLEDNSAMIKRFFKETTRIRLEPIRGKGSSTFIPRVKIQGKVLAVIRKY